LFWDEPRFRYRYTTRVIGLELNLKNPRNPELKRKVLAGAGTEGGIGLKKFVAMTPQEMFPELWETVYQKVAIRQLRREATVQVENAPEGAHTCGRCKSRKTVYTAKQIRSADEPMTVFVTCLQCGKNWKE
jgi:transcription elongation factor S-II